MEADEAIELLFDSSNQYRPILVGGQALSFWVDYYLSDEDQVVSHDLDIHGTQKMAATYAENWPGRLVPANPSDHLVTQQAKVLLTNEKGGNFEVDFMALIGGVETSALRLSAVNLDPRDDSEDSLSPHVMHPLHCVQSSIYNLYANGIRRADRFDKKNYVERACLAVQCLRSYIEEDLSSSDDRNGLSTIKEIRKYCMDSRYAKEAYCLDGIDVLNAIPITSPNLNKNFKEKNWDRIVSEAKSKREKHRKRLLRQGFDL